MTNTDRKTNGRDRAHLARLIEQTRDAIDHAYHQNPRSDEDQGALRGYARDMEPKDKFEALIAAETIHERGHRRMFDKTGERPTITSKHGAAIIVLSNIGDGAQYPERVTPAAFLNIRREAYEALCVGLILRATIPPALLAELLALDYAGAMGVE